MWYLSSRKGRNFKYTPIFSLLASVNCSLRCLFLSGYCREILSTSVRFVILQADIHMSLWLCVPGVVGVDMFLCYYVLQEQFFHPHPDGFYPTRWGLEGSSWGKDGASQTTSVFSRGKKNKSRFIMEVDQDEGLWCRLCHNSKQSRGDTFAVTRSALRPPLGRGIGATTWHKFSGTASVCK